MFFSMDPKKVAPPSQRFCPVIVRCPVFYPVFLFVLGAEGDLAPASVFQVQNRRLIRSSHFLVWGRPLFSCVRFFYSNSQSFAPLIDPALHLSARGLRISPCLGELLLLLRGYVSRLLSPYVLFYLMGGCDASSRFFLQIPSGGTSSRFAPTRVIRGFRPGPQLCSSLLNPSPLD